MRLGAFDTHPFADIFPMMSNEEIAELSAGMRETGFDPGEPVVLYEGKIIDGRNRYCAAYRAGIMPIPTVNYDDPRDPLTFVLQKNLHRRQLTASQRAMVALEVEKVAAVDAKQRREETQGRPSKTGGKNATSSRKAREDAAKALNVSPRSVQSAKRVAKEAPELAEKVRSGEMTVGAAERELKQRREPAPKKKWSKPYPQKVWGIIDALPAPARRELIKDLREKYNL